MRSLLGAAVPVVLSLLAVTGTQRVDAPVAASHLWKARARQAGDNLKILSTRIDALEGERAVTTADELKCQALLEAAFARHLDEEAAVHTVLAGGLEVFKIVLNGGDGSFDLSYFYDATGSTVIAVQVLSVPRSWQLTRSVSHPLNRRSILVSVNDGPDATPRCVLAFGMNEPFFAYVVRRTGEDVALQTRPRIPA